MTDIAAEEGSNRAPVEEELRDQLTVRYADMVAERDEILASAETWKTKLTSQGQADAIVNLEAKMSGLIKRSKTKHDDEKLPYLKASGVIDGFFLSGINKRIAAAASRVAALRGEWQLAVANAERERLRQEAKKRQEEADALRRQEEEARAEERRQEAAKAEEERVAALKRNPNAERPAPPPAPPEPRPAAPQVSAADLAQQTADRARKQAEVRPAALSRIVTDLGASRSLRQRPKGRVIDKGELTESSFAMLLPHIDIAHLDMAANRLAQVMCEEGKPLPVVEGIEFTWEVK